MLVLSSAVLAFLAVACSPSTGGSAGSDGSECTTCGTGGSGTAGGTFIVPGTSGAGSDTWEPGAPPGASGGAPGDETCVAETQRGEGIPLDMFVIWDRSGSMDDDVNGGTKWELVTEAFESFVSDPASAGIGVGIGYFPQFIDGAGSGRNRDDDENTVCDVAEYAGAAVPIAPLPENAAAIMASLDAEETDGRTPTRVALAGAIDHARAWASQHPERKVVVVLQTDGEPNVCESTVRAVADVAAAGLAGTPSMPTYVIGVGEELRNLAEIAQAGGTGDAFIVDTSGDTTRQFIDAMNQIRASASVTCEFIVPTDGTVDYGRVNVTVTPSGGLPALPLRQAQDASVCDPASGGWYYDQPQAPTRIRLCPASCSNVTADTSATVVLEIGCATRPVEIR